MRDVLLLAIVMGLVPLILYRAWIGALAWTWIGLMNPHRYVWALYSFPFAQVIGLAFVAGWLFTRDKRMPPWTPGIVALCILLVFVTVKTPWAWNEVAAFYAWNQYWKIVVAAVLISTVIYTPKRVRWLLWTVLLSIGVFYGVRGGIFAIATGGVHKVQGPIDSFIGGNTHLGVALAMVLPLFVAFMRDAPSALWRFAGIGGFWLTFVAIVFTYSRGAWLGLAVVGALVFLQWKRKVLIVAALVPLASALIVYVPQKLFERAQTIKTYEEDASAMQRIHGWGVALNVATRHPLGAGFMLEATPPAIWHTYANFHDPRFTRSNSAHSIYFQVLGDHGFLGFALYLFVLLGTFWTLARVKRAARDGPDKAWLGHYATALQIGLAGYCVAGAFVSLAYFDLFYLYVVLAGILLREARTTASEVRVETAEPSRSMHQAIAGGGRA